VNAKPDPTDGYPWNMHYYPSIDEFRDKYYALFMDTPHSVSRGARALFLDDCVCIVFDGIISDQYLVRDLRRARLMPSDFTFIPNLLAVGDVKESRGYVKFIVREMIGEPGISVRRVVAWATSLLALLVAAILAFAGSGQAYGLAISGALVVLSMFASVFIVLSDRFTATLARDPELLANAEMHDAARTDRYVLFSVAGACAAAVMAGVVSVAALSHLPVPSSLAGHGLVRVALSCLLFIVVWVMLWCLVSVIPYYDARWGAVNARQGIRMYFGGRTGEGRETARQESKSGRIDK
jgi:hypothetical protein